VTETQRRDDALSFDDYTAVHELRDAAMRMALVFGEANAHGAAAGAEVELSERELLQSVAGVRSRLADHGGSERSLLKTQIQAALELSDLTNEAMRSKSGVRLELRRDALLERFVGSNDELLGRFDVARREARRGAVQRPVMLVAGLFLLFGLLHVLFVERPASRTRRRRRSQVEFIEAMQVARSEAEAYDLLSRHVEQAVEALRVTVLNRNNSADRLEAVTPVEPGSPTAQGLDGAAPDSCLAIRLARSCHRTADSRPLLRCDVCGMNAGQTTCTPSLVSGEVIGALLVEHRQPLGSEQRRVVEDSATEAAPVIANLRNLAVAEMRAATDGLTGLANQRTVHETLKRAAAHAGRSTSPLAVVLFDLDHFKAINDSYGHGKGDDVLAAVAAAAASAVRASDFVGRLGGEEFAVVLPDTDRAGGILAAEKIRAAIATISVPGVDRPISASFGVAVMPDDAGEPELLLRAADRALYGAKRAGRDRVETVYEAAANERPHQAQKIV
jgi:diguanylate cyclase (GGDEF)-like protein